MILVTGGAGVMGSRLVRRLVAAGERVRALVLPGDPCAKRLAGCDCEIVEGDITHAAGLDDAMHEVTTVFHLAAVIVSHQLDVFRRVNVEGTANVAAAAAKSGVRHVVYVSSASVTYRRPTAYAQSKIDAEETIRNEQRFAHTIVRPTLVYDRAGGQEIEMFAKLIRKFPVVPFIGKGEAKKRPVYAGDIIDGLARIVGNKRAHGNTYNLSGAEATTMMGLARLLAEQLNLKRVFVPVPEFLCRAGLTALGAITRLPALAHQIMSGFTEDADLDPTDAMRDLGYEPLPVSVGLRRYFHRRA